MARLMVAPSRRRGVRLFPAAADRAFKLLKANPRHPSLRLKNVGKYYSVRVGLHHRALGVPINDGILWFWIGSHEEYDRIIS